jgi:hypothetical protein
MTVTYRSSGLTRIPFTVESGRATWDKLTSFGSTESNRQTLKTKRDRPMHQASLVGGDANWYGVGSTSYHDSYEVRSNYYYTQGT